MLSVSRPPQTPLAFRVFTLVSVRVSSLMVVTRVHTPGASLRTRLDRYDSNSYHYRIMRTSRQREAILRVVQGTDCHPTAEWVYWEVKKSIPNISLGTVYRNLRLLAEHGDVCAFDGSGGFSRYDGCTASHYHFRCERCGVVVDIDEPVDPDLDHRMSERSGFAIRCHVLEFRGMCPACQQRTISSVAALPRSIIDQVSEEVSNDGSVHCG